MLHEVADGVWVRQSAWVWSNAIVVRGEGGLILVDPGIDGSELNELADDLDRLGIAVVAGFCTHPHWDHLLWHPRFGDVPRYGTAACARAAGEGRKRGQVMAAASASGIPLELLGLVTALPADGESGKHVLGYRAIEFDDEHRTGHDCTLRTGRPSSPPNNARPGPATEQHEQPAGSSAVLAWLRAAQ